MKYLYVYILKCSDNSYYTGITNNPSRRVKEHNSGENKSCYTAKRLPLTMVYCAAFTDFALAISWEKRIKTWSKKKKEALINENWSQLRIEAECKNETTHKNHNYRLARYLDSARYDNAIKTLTKDNIDLDDNA